MILLELLGIISLAFPFNYHIMYEKSGYLSTDLYKPLDTQLMVEIHAISQSYQMFQPQARVSSLVDRILSRSNTDHVFQEN